MKELKTILFPTDFTEDATQAYIYALNVAARTGAELHLLHVIEDPFDFATRVEETVEVLIEEAESRFEQIKAEARQDKEYQQVSLESYVLRGEIGRAHV